MNTDDTPMEPIENVEEVVSPYDMDEEERIVNLLIYRVNTYMDCMEMTFPVPTSIIGDQHQASIWTTQEMTSMKKELRLMMKELSGYEISTDDHS